MGNCLSPEKLAVAEIGNNDLNANVYITNSNIVESMKIHFLPHPFHP